MESITWREATEQEVRDYLWFIVGADLDGGILTIYMTRDHKKFGRGEYDAKTTYPVGRYPWLRGALKLNETGWVMPIINTMMPLRACIGDSPSGWFVEEPA